MSKKKATRPKIPPGVKVISVYGSYTKEANILVRVLKTRVDGVKQHYWVKSGEKEMREFSGRFGFYGSGRDLGRAVMITDNVVPKGTRFQIVSAKDFNTNPYKYGTYGHWISRNVDS